MKPNPGSDEARASGCSCAVLDNNHGRFAPFPPDGWWITEGCPVHAWVTDDEFGIDLDPCEHASINGDECATCGQRVLL